MRENPDWGYRRVHGELLVLGIKVAASTVWEILNAAGVDPAPERASTTWTGFLRSQAEALLACDFLETVTLSGARMYVFAVIEHHTRRIRVLGATAHPWDAQAPPPPAYPSRRKTIDHHPAVGPITLDCDTLLVTLDDLRITVYTAEPGTEDADRLDLAVVLGTQSLQL
ncbi:hypothetical protein [Actinomadura nitritigenes]|uniref:MmyB family transcriptional regulator n=1 Tax=Actinomadura nitritigenes TaxID=134602 RepID=UPI003D8BFB77